ncbi:MAG: hypothetical protein ACYC61_14860 [Isosphaeraceae bacterium]
MDQPVRRPERVIPRNGASQPAPAPAPPSPPPPSVPDQSVFVPSAEANERRSRRWTWIGVALLALLAIGAVGVMVYWPRLRPRPRHLDAVEQVAGHYLDALVRNDDETKNRLGLVE